MMLTKKLLVEQDPYQTRVAVIEADRVAEVYHEPATGGGLRGQVFKGRVHRVLPGMQAAFVDLGLERDAFLHVEDVRPPGVPEEATIDDLLKPGQELVVQVAKGPLPNKGARVSAQVTLPGRFLVYLPYGDQSGVSRRIEDETERERLRQILDQLDPPGRFIARTVAEGGGVADLEEDANRLRASWERLSRRAESTHAPELLHRDLGVALGAVRDLFDDTFAALWVQGNELAAEIEEFLGTIEPGLRSRVQRWQEEQSLLAAHGVDDAIEAALRPRVWLKSGGYLVIQPTEALVAIDVNTGRNVGRRSLGETILQTNLEAVAETARQIRLRNLFGIVVLDLIDMEEEEHRQQVYGALEQALSRDRVRTQILSISEFGLIEMTRKRSRPSLYSWLTRDCAHCRGQGRVQAPEFVVDRLRRHLLDRRPTGSSDELVVRLEPAVAAVLRGTRRDVVGELEAALGRPVRVVADASVPVDRFELDYDFPGGG